MKLLELKPAMASQFHCPKVKAKILTMACEALTVLQFRPHLPLSPIKEPHRSPYYPLTRQAASCIKAFGFDVPSVCTDFPQMLHGCLPHLIQFSAQI